MKLKNILITTLLAFGLSITYAQNYTQIIEQITVRSLAGKALQTQFTTDSLSYRRGLNPDDPAVSAEFFLPSGVELEIEQTIDFPTLYIHRGKLSKLNIGRSWQEMKLNLQQTMLAVSENYIMAIYRTKQVKILTARNASLEKYVAGVAKAVDKGEKTRIELVAAQTLLAQMKSRLVDAQVMLKQSKTNMAQWSYTTELPTVYPTFIPIERERFMELATSGDLSLAITRADSLIAARTLKVSRSEWLPKLKVGYRIELEEGTNRSAIKAGVSIPIWQNRNNIKHSKALINSTKAQTAAVRKSVEASLENIYSSYEAADRALAAFPDNFDIYIDLLRKSFEGGTMTETDYMLALSDRYEYEQNRLTLQMQKQLNRAIIEILMTPIE